jgi:hypothetical protein
VLHVTDEEVSSSVIVLAYAKISTVTGVDIKIILYNFRLLSSPEYKKLIMVTFYKVLLYCLETHSPAMVTYSFALSLFSFL